MQCAIALSTAAALQQPSKDFPALHHASHPDGASRTTALTTSYRRRVLGHGQGVPARQLGEGRAGGGGRVRPARGALRGHVRGGGARGAVHVHGHVAQVR